jgi:hypothetical protein
MDDRNPQAGMWAGGPQHPARPEGSAWSTPAVPPVADVRSRARGGWLVGGVVGAVVLAAAVVAGVMATSSGSGSAPAGSQAGSPWGGHGAGAAAPPAGKVFTHAGDECALIKPATIAAIAPGATCKKAVTDGFQQPGYTLVQPRWSGGQDGSDIDVNLDIGADAEQWYGTTKQAYLHSAGMLDKLEDQRSYPGLGDEAFVAYAVDPSGAQSGSSEIIVRWGNAVVEVSYRYDHDVSGGPVTQQQAEDAAVAAAKDALASLS